MTLISFIEILFLMFCFISINTKEVHYEDIMDNSIDSYLLSLNNFNSTREKEQYSKATPKLVCYYIFTNDFKADILKNLCTHIIVGFIGIHESNYSLDISNEQLKILSEVILLKENYPDIQILISVGGANMESFTPMVKNHTSRKMFIKSSMDLIKRFKLDGINLDWEWPSVNGDPKEKKKLIQLLFEIREEFNRHKNKYILSMDVPAIQGIIEIGYYVQYIAQYVNFVNVMCYDYFFFKQLLPLTGHNSPLYATNSRFLENFNANFSVNFWISKLMPREKIVLGLPAYGHTYKLSSNQKHGIFAPARDVGSVGKDGFASYSQICAFISNATIVFDEGSKVPYAYAFPEWISFDNEMSLAIKASYAVEENLGGVMMFSVNVDDYSGVCNKNGITFPLIKAVRSILFNKI